MDKGVITHYLNQLLVDGTLNAEEHPSIRYAPDVILPAPVVRHR